MIEKAWTVAAADHFRQITISQQGRARHVPTPPQRCLKQIIKQTYSHQNSLSLSHRHESSKFFGVSKRVSSAPHVLYKLPCEILGPGKHHNSHRVRVFCILVVLKLSIMCENRISGSTNSPKLIFVQFFLGQMLAKASSLTCVARLPSLFVNHRNKKCNIKCPCLKGENDSKKPFFSLSQKHSCLELPKSG